MRISTAKTTIQDSSCLFLTLTASSMRDLEGDIIHALGKFIHCMILFKTTPRFFAHPDGFVWILPQMLDCPPHTLRIPWFHKQSRLAVLKISFCAGCAGRHHCLAEAHRLEQAAVAAGEIDGLKR